MANVKKMYHTENMYVYFHQRDWVCTIVNANESKPTTNPFNLLEIQRYKDSTLALHFTEIFEVNIVTFLSPKAAFGRKSRLHTHVCNRLDV